MTHLIRILTLLLIALAVAVTVTSAQSRLEAGLLLGGNRYASGYSESRIGGYGRVDALLAKRFGLVGDLSLARARKQFGSALLVAGEVNLRWYASERLRWYALSGARGSYSRAFGGKGGVSAVVGVGRTWDVWEAQTVYELPDSSENRVQMVRVDLARQLGPLVVRGSVGPFWFNAPHDPGGARSGLHAEIRVGVTIR